MAKEGGRGLELPSSGIAGLLFGALLAKTALSGGVERRRHPEMVSLLLSCVGVQPRVTPSCIPAGPDSLSPFGKLDLSQLPAAAEVRVCEARTPEAGGVLFVKGFADAEEVALLSEVGLSQFSQDQPDSKGYGNRFLRAGPDRSFATEHQAPPAKGVSELAKQRLLRRINARMDAMTGSQWREPYLQAMLQAHSSAALIALQVHNRSPSKLCRSSCCRTRRARRAHTGATCVCTTSGTTRRLAVRRPRATNRIRPPQTPIRCPSKNPTPAAPAPWPMPCGGAGKEEDYSPRYATVLVYLRNPPQGGHTLFPTLRSGAAPPTADADAMQAHARGLCTCLCARLSTASAPSLHHHALHRPPPPPPPRHHRRPPQAALRRRDHQRRPYAAAGGGARDTHAAHAADDLARHRECRAVLWPDHGRPHQPSPAGAPARSGHELVVPLVAHGPPPPCTFYRRCPRLRAFAARASHF